MSIYSEFFDCLKVSDEKKSELYTDLSQKLTVEQSPVPQRKKQIFRWTGIAAATVVVLCCAIIPALLLTQPKEGGNITPDFYNKILINEHLTEVKNDGKYDVVFNSVYLTQTIEGQSPVDGGYLVFQGEIEAPKFMFRSEEIFLDLNIAKIESNPTERIEFNPLLSKALSEIDLRMDGQEGFMDGQFCLVFEIDATNFDLIKSKTNQTSFEDNQGTQIRLHTNIRWGSTKTNVFDFSCDDVKS